ncbi:MAG TPA: DUF3560 domain-containing protein, partial [Polyangiaceae bacterium]
LRIRVIRDLGEVLRNERLAARQACSDRLRAARRLPRRAEQRHAELVAERKHELEKRRIERADRKRQKSEACLSCVHETDEQVRTNLTSDMLPLFEKVGHSIKGGRGLSRTEAFLKYAEKHPDEVLASTSHEAEVRVRALEAEHAALSKKPNAFEAKKAARIERLRERAARLKGEAEASSRAAHAIADRIPMGQPILVGHHSEKRHRGDVERIHRGHGRAAELSKEATTLERRAERSETSGAVSSDDPDAIPKLHAKLADIERDRERMVAANRAVRSSDPRAALRALGFSDMLIEKALTPDFMGRVGFPDYALGNAAAEARRLRKRIEQLEKQRARPARATVHVVGAHIEERENRVRIIFEGKPDEAVRTALKKSGFHWSPSAGAWQRHASNAAWAEAERLVKTPHLGTSRVMRVADIIPIHRGAVVPERKVKGEGLDTAGVAKRIREDIALDVREGRLPKATYSVRIERFSMGSSITVRASGFDFAVLNPDAFRVAGRWVELDRPRFTTRLTEEARLVERTLNVIVDGYHWDRSDPNSDSTNVRFYRHVEIEPKKGEWEAIERAKLAEAGIGGSS